MFAVVFIREGSESVDDGQMLEFWSIAGLCRPRSRKEAVSYARSDFGQEITSHCKVFEDWAIYGQRRLSICESAGWHVSLA